MQAPRLRADMAEHRARLVEIVATATAVDAIVREQQVLAAAGGCVGAGRVPTRATQLGVVRFPCHCFAVPYCVSLFHRFARVAGSER